MRKTKKHKQFIKEIKQHSKCTLTPEDIYKNTDFFDNKQPTTKPTYKLAFMVSVIIVFISLTLTTCLLVQNNKLKNKEPEVVYIEQIFHIIDDTQGMPKGEKEIITNSLDKFNINPFVSYVHDTNTIFYLYYGYNLNHDESKTYYYYYAFSNFKYDYDSLIININDTTLTITNDNRYGLLTTINEKETSDFTISFMIETVDKKCEYVLKNCNYSY